MNNNNKKEFYGIKKNLVFAAMLFGFIIVSGTFLYKIIVNEWSWWQACFMVIKNIIGDPGDSVDMSIGVQMIASCMMLFSFVVFAYIASCFISLITFVNSKGILVDAMEKKLVDSFDEHIVICGYGKMGRKIVDKMKSNYNRGVVVVDLQEGAMYDAEEQGVVFIQGDACDKSVLLSAGVGRAKYVVVSFSNVATAVLCSVVVKMINKNVLILAKSIDGDSVQENLINVGADYIINPYELGADKIVELLKK